MKILKILGIAAGLHAVALILIFANPGCSYTKAASNDAPPISAAPAGDSSAQGAAAAPQPITVRYSPTRPGTVVASALETQPVADVMPATTYTVARGDSLWSVAKANHLSKADLAAANNLKAGALLHVGQKLIIPAKAGAIPVPAASAPAPKAFEAAAAEKPSGDSLKHLVKPGETLGAIARKYGVRQGDIAVANNITDPRKIQPGQELVIPARSAAAKAKGFKPKAEAPELAKAAAATVPPGANQDLDAGLKPSSAADIPVVKIEDNSQGAQPKGP